jgi:hypothetical protein
VTPVCRLEADVDLSPEWRLDTERELLVKSEMTAIGPGVDFDSCWVTLEDSQKSVVRWLSLSDRFGC